MFFLLLIPIPVDSSSLDSASIVYGYRNGSFPDVPLPAGI